MKKKKKQLIDISILAKFEDGVRVVGLKESTRNAILNLIVLSEGSIKVCESVIDGIDFNYPLEKDKVKITSFKN